MSVRIKTLIQSLSREDANLSDAVLAQLLNVGWEIICISHHMNSSLSNDETTSIRIVTLKQNMKELK